MEEFSWVVVIYFKHLAESREDVCGVCEIRWVRCGSEGWEPLEMMVGVVCYRCFAQAVELNYAGLGILTTAGGVCLGW